MAKDPQITRRQLLSGLRLAGTALLIEKIFPFNVNAGPPPQNAPNTLFTIDKPPYVYVPPSPERDDPPPEKPKIRPKTVEELYDEYLKESPENDPDSGVCFFTKNPDGTIKREQNGDMWVEGIIFPKDNWRKPGFLNKERIIRLFREPQKYSEILKGRYPIDDFGLVNGAEITLRRQQLEAITRASGEKMQANLLKEPKTTRNIIVVDTKLIDTFVNRWEKRTFLRPPPRSVLTSALKGNKPKTP